MNRTKIINLLANKISAKSYLEIGTRIHSHNYVKINIPNKVGVDPCIVKFDREPTYKLTSDEFFFQNQNYFDIIFIDGLHEAQQFYRDIVNSLSFLNKGGYIICHDLNPKNYYRQLRFNDPQRIAFINRPHNKYPNLWSGDIWKAWVELKTERFDLNMFVINADFGCGVIQRGSQDLLDLGGLDLTYKNFCQNRKRWLNLISKQDFINFLSNDKN